jgi:hypothetical protein
LAAAAPVLFASAPRFLARRDYAPASTFGIAVADTRGNGILDVIGVGYGEITVLFGRADGTFRPGPTSQVGTADIISPAAASLDGAGTVDIVFSGYLNNTGTSGIGVSLGNGDGTFQTATTYAAGTDRFIGNLILGDFNGDGVPDAVTTGESGIWLFIGTGGGAFSPGELISVPTNGEGGQVAVADFNHDGNLDLAVTTPTGFAILLGNGNGTFGPPEEFAAPASGGWIAVGDLNLDGLPDVVLVTSLTSSSVYLNSGSGGFSGPMEVSLPTYGPIAIADVNGDGIPDLISDIGYIDLGKGNGTFGAPQYHPLPSGNTTAHVVPADLRHNGRTDLVFVDPDGSISVLLNLGKGAFEDGEWQPLAASAGCGVAADFNGDGKQDLAMNTSTGISILLGTGKASPPFTPGTSIALEYAGCLVTGDVNGDGVPDLLVPTPFGVVTYLGNGDGTFTLKSTTPTTIEGYLALADFNHDGKLDFATSGNLIALGNGDGTFQTPTTLAPMPPPIEGFTNLAAGDVNNDGWPDVILSSDDISRIYVLLNNQHGGFTESSFFSGVPLANFGPTEVLLADLAGNGVLDIVAASIYGGGAAVYLGNGKGGFGDQEQLSPQNFTDSASAIAVGDLNGDGKLDIIVTQGGGGSTLGIYLGKGDGFFEPPFYIGAGPSPSDLVLEKLHSQPAGFADIVAPDGTGGVTILLNTGK